MKKLTKIILLASAFSFFGLNGCKDEEVKITSNQNGKLTLDFTHHVDGAVLSKNISSYYVNAAGNQYIATTLLYYISHIELTKVDGTKVKFPIYKLIDGLSTLPQTIELTEIPNGEYKSISYNIGIDSIRNHSGSQDGDLSPTKGMLWTWSTGYLFLKLEGFYRKNGNNESFRYHIGTDASLNKINTPIAFTIKGNELKADMSFNLAEFFKNPNTWDIALKDDLQSFPNETAQTAQLANNMKDMIRIIKVE
jgi:hypothetical protein